MDKLFKPSLKELQIYGNRTTDLCYKFGYESGNISESDLRSLI